MGEIKSAIELAMERTKDLRLSKEEKEQLKEEEIHAKAHGLVNRFLEIDYHFREAEKELAQYDPELRARLEKLMLQYFAEAIHLGKDNDLIFQGIESLAAGSSGLITKTRELAEKYQKEEEKEKQKVRKGLLSNLEKLGISGSAVEPKVEGSQAWKVALAKLNSKFEGELRDLKERLSQLSLKKK